MRIDVQVVFLPGRILVKSEFGMKRGERGRDCSFFVCKEIQGKRLVVYKFLIYQKSVERWRVMIRIAFFCRRRSGSK